MLIVRTPVRISFAGGGTDLPSYYEEWGGLVLSSSIDKYIYTVLTERDDGCVQVISSDLKTLETVDRIERMHFEGTDLEIPFAVLKYLGSEVSVNLFLASEVPPGTGLGSSAAVCVNVLKTISVHLGREFSEHDLAEKAFWIARHMLRRPVGKQDEYAAAFGGINILRFSADRVEVEPVRLTQESLMDFEQCLMLFFTGSSRNSSQILEAQDQSVQSRDAAVLEALAELKDLVLPMRNALLSGDLDSFGHLLHLSWEVKKRVSGKISSTSIDTIYETARTHGALGGKITGAGGGGFLLLFCPKDKQQPVRQAMRGFGLKELRFHCDLGGTRVVYNDPFFDSDARGGMRWIFTPSLQGYSLE